jgi:hypothetical protein
MLPERNTEFVLYEYHLKFTPRAQDGDDLGQ